MPAPQIIHRLIDQFERNRAAYTSQKYNETLLRQEFLNPFFEALGWDVANESGFAMQYRQVVHEDRVDVDGSMKAPDYAFRIGGVRKFFVEAKKPAENIETDASLAYQLRRYAWNAHLPLSILTDFEEFAVYDCRSKPNPGDNSATSRILLLKSTDYVERWDEIAAIFSPEAIQQGAFDRFAEDNTGKRGTIKVDDAFLADIEEWRTLLARNIALRNPQVADERQLNFAVQMIIDRIIFLRICEDRKIEQENQLQEISQHDGIYPALVNLFERADLRYNSGLFHFKKEKHRSDSIDSLTPTLVVDDKVLKEIVKDLYYPSPYIFNEIPVEILGQVYEQFLGKVIRLTAGHRAKVEEKPEVRKAGGVYYTPKYIVDYIVEHTVGALLEGKTPKDAAKLKIVDPACGSGSFLLGAFQYLLDWHEQWYLDHAPAKWAQGTGAALIPAADGGWRISTGEKKRILLNNIFGVDIDAQAVEVTKLSLLLKVLEGETGQLSLGFERVLPDLGQNIQCGNSLIGPDYYDGKQLGLFNEDEMYRINAFDWKRAFSEVFAQGGFDAVIGNPPYVRQEMLGEDKDYFIEHFDVFHGMADLYTYFIEKGVSVLKQGGIFSYIVANKWLRTTYGMPLRVFLKKNKVSEIIDFGDLPVFQDATTYPCIIRLKKHSKKEKLEVSKIKSLKFQNLNEYVKSNLFSVDYSMLNEDGWILKDKKTLSLYEKIMGSGIQLSRYINDCVYRGIVTGYNKAFVISPEIKRRLVDADKRNQEIIKPFLIGRDIKRYSPVKQENFLIFTRRGINISNYPSILAYLLQFKEKLVPKPKNWKGEKWNGRKAGNYKWYEIQDTIDYYLEFEKEKIIYPNICKKPEFTIDYNGFYSNQKCFIIPKDDKFLLGILNSKLSHYIFTMLLPKLRGGFYEPSYIYMKNFPIKKVDLTKPDEVTQRKKIILLVEQMLDITNRYTMDQTPTEKAQLQRQIDTTDAEIDRLVYDLYGLTEEEIRIVEESVK